MTTTNTQSSSLMLVTVIFRCI